MKKLQDPDKQKALGDIFAGVESAPLPAIAPDGGFAPGDGMVGPPAPLPEATPENMICLRGPCRHYWELESHFESGNPAETWEKLGRRPPRMVHRTCLVQPGVETEITEDIVFRCSRWDPQMTEERTATEHRRKRYLAKYPHIAALLEEREPRKE